jgi:hypothetical protein
MNPMELQGGNGVLFLRFYSDISLEGLRKITENLSQNNPSSGQLSNPEPSKYKAG